MTDPDFTLDPQLVADTHGVTQWPLSEVLLMDDVRFPWLILVPRVAGVREPFELSADQQQQLLNEAMAAGRCLSALHNADKINTAALGNVVSQLHVHVVARLRDDAVWPRPVWGVGEPCRYGADALDATLNRLRARLPVL